MRLLRSVLLASAVALAVPSAACAQGAGMTAAHAQPGDLSFERVFASPSLSGPAPRGVALSPDGRWLTLLRNRDDDRERYDLWGYDRENGQWRMLVDSTQLGTGRALSEAEKMQRERQRIGNLKGIVAYEWAADGSGILVPLDGDLHLAKLDGTTRRLTDTPEAELNPALSAQGRYLSFVRDGRLYVGAVAGPAAPVPITPEESETVHWGEAEFVAQEELDRATGYWWSPGDRRIAVERFDEAPVGIVTRAAIGAEGTSVYQQRYPAAGTPNVLAELHVMDPDGQNRVQVDLGENREIYIGRVDWAPDGRTLYVQRLDRAQTRLDMLAVDPATGVSRVLFSEEAAPESWINLTSNYKWLDDGSLVWWSERSGYGHLYRWRAGKWQQLTRGDWVVTSLDGVDQRDGSVLFTATKDDPLAPQVYALDLKSPGKVTRLTDPAYANSAQMDGAGRSLIVSRSKFDQPLQSYLADTAGQRLTWIEENRVAGDHPYAPFLASHAKPEYGTIRGPGGQDLHYMMIRPRIEPGKRYPVFFEHYGGPHVQVVNKGWVSPLAQAIVDRGYVYFELDNRGSANRGVAFENPIWRAMGSVEVADQRAGAQWLRGQSFVDPAKIATYGWSYGGYMTLKMLEADQGLYAAGIAGAPVTKWELYDTAYTERYMGTPQADAAAYAASDAIAEAGRIADPLLLIHGMADDNVVFENSTAMAATLQAQGVPFEMMFYPGYTHRVSGPAISPHLWHTIFGFLDRHGVTPPE